MRRVGIEIVGNAVSGIRAMAKTSEAAVAMGKEFTAVGVKAEKSAEAQINAAVRSRRAIEANIAVAQKLAGTYAAGSREQIAAMNLVSRHRKQLGRSLATTEAEAAGLTGGGVRGTGRGRLLRFGRAGAAVRSGSMGILGVGPEVAIAAAATFGGYEAIKASARFRSEMLLIQTQAGASSKEVDKMSGAVLKLSAKVGQSPDALAKGLYHIESYGYRGAKALKLLTLAAEGAAVGKDDIESTTNALLVMSKRGSHIKGVGNETHAMGLLDAIVGAGNMRMPQLTAAFGTGVLSAATNFGVTMPELGASIATLTHAGQDPSEAATRLRMTFSLMAAGSDKAEKVLEKLGLSHKKLAHTMRTQGLGAAFKELRDHLLALPIDERSAAMTRMFGGGRSSAGVMTMLQQLSNYDRTLKQITTNTGRFDKSWQATSHTLSFRARQGLSGARAGLVAVGDRLTPVITRGVNAAVSYVQAHLPQIRATFQSVASDVRTIWGAVWPTVSRIARAAIAAIVPTIRNIARVVRGVVELVKGLIHGNWHLIWKGAKDIVGAVFGQIGVLAKTTVKMIGAAFHAIVGVFRGIWSSVKNLTSSFFGWLEAKAITVALKMVEPFSHLPRWLGGGWAQDMKKSLQGTLDGIHKTAAARKAAEKAAEPKAAGGAHGGGGGLDGPTPRHRTGTDHPTVHIHPIHLDSGSGGKGSLIPRGLHDAVLNARLTKGRADDIKTLQAEEAYLRQKLAHAEKGSKLYDRLLAQEVSVHSQIEAAKNSETAAAKKRAELVKKSKLFTIPMSMQVAEARAGALGALDPNQQGPTNLQFSLAKQLKNRAMIAIRSHHLSMQGLIDAWNSVAQANQTLAQKSKGMTGTYHAVSTRALTEGLNLSRNERVLLEERLAQRAAHRGHAPSGPAAQGKLVHEVHVFTHDEDHLIKKIEHRTRHQTQRSGGRR